MNCPVDETPTDVREFQVQGRVVILRQCPTCMGIWALEPDLDYLNHAIVSDLDRGSPPVNRDPYIRCPIDHAVLTTLEQASGIVDVRSCPVCRGTWFPAGNLTRYVAIHGQRSSPRASSLRNFVVPNLMLFMGALAAAAFGFSSSSRLISADSAGRELSAAGNFKAGLWFLVLLELLVWPIVFTRDIKRFQALHLRQPMMSYFWLAIIIATTITTFVITKV